MLVELRLEALEQRERISGRPRKTGQHTIAVKATHLACGRLDDDVAERHLSVAAERNGCAAADGKDRRSVKCFHHQARKFRVPR